MWSDILGIRLSFRNQIETYSNDNKNIVSVLLFDPSSYKRKVTIKEI
jgi:hypothetical protein